MLSGRTIQYKNRKKVLGKSKPYQSRDKTFPHIYLLLDLFLPDAEDAIRLHSRLMLIVQSKLRF